MNLTGRSLLSLNDYTKEEILYLIDLAIKLKTKKARGEKGNSLAGKNIALIFEKPSTRTRCAFTVAANDEGAFPEYLGKNDIQLGHKESIEDTARVLGRLFDGIQFRGFSQEAVEKLARYSGVPVWNGLTDLYHPTQVLADLMTIKEHVGRLEDLTVTFIGDGRNNVANSLMIGCSKVGLNVTIIAPKVLFPDAELINYCSVYANESGSKIVISDNTKDIKGSDVVYTDVWVSMGEEEKSLERLSILKKYQVNEELMGMTGKDNSIVMHCLPAVKGNEITEEIFERNANVIFDEAENRMHTIKAVMVATASSRG